MGNYAVDLECRHGFFLPPMQGSSFCGNHHPGFLLLLPSLMRYGATNHPGAEFLRWLLISGGREGDFVDEIVMLEGI